MSCQAVSGRLTASPIEAWESPAFSPSGRRIAFVSDRAGGNYEIYKMRADGTHQHRLTHRAYGVAPAFSPSGKRIAFDSNGDIYTMRADGTHRRRLTHNSLFDGSPDWGPRR